MGGTPPTVLLELFPLLRLAHSVLSNVPSPATKEHVFGRPEKVGEQGLDPPVASRGQSGRFLPPRTKGVGNEPNALSVRQEKNKSSRTAKRMRSTSHRMQRGKACVERDWDLRVFKRPGEGDSRCWLCHARGWEGEPRVWKPVFARKEGGHQGWREQSPR